MLVSSLLVLVLLPPSETKASGGDGPPLRLDALSHPELTPVRRKLLATAPRAVSDADGVARIARFGGLEAHRTGEHTLDLIIPA